MNERASGPLAYRRGHPIRKSSDGRWRWADTGRFVRLGSSSDDPACVACAAPPTPEGHDPCLERVEGAISVCCGHGVTTGHVTFRRGTIHTLPAAIVWGAVWLGSGWALPRKAPS